MTTRAPSPKALEFGELSFARLNKKHIPLLLPVEHEAYPDPWTQGMFLQEIRNGTSHFYVVFRDDTLVAYGGFWLILDEVHITKLTVASACRRTGLGAVLLEFLMQAGRDSGGADVRLEVRESNIIARRLYARAGFQEIGVRKNYYGASKEDAIVMVKSLATTSAGAPPHSAENDGIVV